MVYAIFFNPMKKMAVLILSLQNYFHRRCPTQQVNKVLRPMVEQSLFLDGKSDPERVKVALTETEEVVRSHVTKANFIREVQQYLKVRMVYSLTCLEIMPYVYDHFEFFV